MRCYHDWLWPLFSRKGSARLALQRARRSGDCCADIVRGHAGAKNEWIAEGPNRLVAIQYMDCTRRSMFEALQKEYDKMMRVAKSYGVGKIPLPGVVSYIQ